MQTFWRIANTATLVAYVLLFGDVLSSAGSAPGIETRVSSSGVEQALACVFEVDAFNRDRYVRQEVQVECSPEVSSHPWGNWGIESFWGYRYDGDQYTGWKFAEGHIEWNSCTKVPYVGCDYFNANSCTEQQGVLNLDRKYGSADFMMVIEEGFENDGCENFDGMNLTTWNNWFSAWELDDVPLNSDDWVDRVTYSAFIIPLVCGYGSCNVAWSNSLWALGDEGIISQEVQAKLVNSFLDWVDIGEEECDPCEV